MSQRRWTVVVVPHASSRTKTWELSLRALKIVCAVFGTVVVASAFFGFTVISKSVDLSRLEFLERHNRTLVTELESAQDILSGLKDTVASIARRDQQVRLLAGLEPIDPDVQQAGIGGPVGVPSERDLVLGATGIGQDALELSANLKELVRRANLVAASYNQVVDSLEVHKDRLERTPSIMPTSGWLTSHFTNERFHPIYHEARPHQGIDVAAPAGTPIVAPADGRVTDVRTGIGYGKMVAIDHGGGVVTRYAHCSQILVKVGERVKRGDKIALVGRTGIATAPHLHYEVLVSGRPRDPRTYILPETITD